MFGLPRSAMLPRVTEAAAHAEEGAIERGSILGGRYRVEEEIGSGAMGQVYRVVHETLRLPLALKILHPELAVVPEVRQRLEREARLSAWLDHPAVVQVTDYGTHAGRPYIVMRLVDGEELSSRLERGRIPPPQAVDLGVALCSGLAHAHGMGLVHRDLKPENVLLTARGLRILDFGLARAIASDDPRLTRTGLVCGTPRYMSPEQASGDPIDVRSDVYAVGVLLHEMLRGEPMFDGPNAAAVLRRQIVDAPPPLALKPHREIDTRKLEAVVQRALAKDPAHRYPDALSLEADLAACRRPRRLPRWTRVLVALGLIALIAAAAVAATMILRDPLLEARAALAAGQAELAERSLKAFLQRKPDGASARLLLGHAAWSQGEAARAAQEWAKAVRLAPGLAGDSELLDAAPAAVDALYGRQRRDRARAANLVQLLAERAEASGAPLLGRLVEEGPSFRLRRVAYEGLQRLDAIEVVDAFGFLSADLAAQRNARCSVRRWYVSRLVELGTGAAEALIAQERERKGSGCLQSL